MPRLRTVKVLDDEPSNVTRQPLNLVNGKQPEEELYESKPDGGKSRFEAPEPDEQEEQVIEVIKKPTKPKVKEPDEATASLAKQLEEMKKAKEVSDRQAQENARQIDEVRKQAREREERLVNEADQANYNAILNAIGATQAEIDSAKKDIETAGNAGAWNEVASAQERMSKASSRLTQLEDGKASIEYRKEHPEKPRQEEKQATQGDPIETHINAMPGLLDSERTWLKSHRELMSDVRKNARLQSAHFDAEDAGHTRGSPEYFDFIEQKLGYKKPVQQEREDDEDEQEERTIVAAPVSRETPSAGTGKPSKPNQIRLTAVQREIARNAGITDVEYARQLIKMQEAKEEGLLQ